MRDEDVRRRYLELMGLEGDEYATALAKYSLEDYYFLRALSEDRDPYPGFEVGVRDHELVDAVYRSAAEGGNEVAITS